MLLPAALSACVVVHATVLGCVAPCSDPLVLSSDTVYYRLHDEKATQDPARAAMPRYLKVRFATKTWHKRVSNVEEINIEIRNDSGLVPMVQFYSRFKNDPKARGNNVSHASGCKRSPWSGTTVLVPLTKHTRGAVLETIRGYWLQPGTYHYRLLYTEPGTENKCATQWAPLVVSD